MQIFSNFGGAVSRTGTGIPHQSVETQSNACMDHDRASRASQTSQRSVLHFCLPGPCREDLRRHAYAYPVDMHMCGPAVRAGPAEPP